MVKYYVENELQCIHNCFIALVVRGYRDLKMLRGMSDSRGNCRWKNNGSEGNIELFQFDLFGSTMKNFLEGFHYQCSLRYQWCLKRKEIVEDETENGWTYVRWNANNLRVEIWSFKHLNNVLDGVFIDSHVAESERESSSGAKITFFAESTRGETDINWSLLQAFAPLCVRVGCKE